MSSANIPTMSNSASTSTLYDSDHTAGGEANERTHLLKKHTKHVPSSLQKQSEVVEILHHDRDDDRFRETQRDVVDPETGTKGQEVEVFEPGKATFNQTLLNVLGDLIGTGLLASPIAIAHAGWVVGPLFLCVICAVTLWTLKILIRVIEKDRSIRNFADVARFGLGATFEKWITTLFVGDCFIWLIALVVLFSDSMNAVWPIYSSNQWKLIGLAVIIPLNFVPMRYLSYTSALGVISTWALVIILIFTGLATPHHPGSIREPAPTDLWPTHGIIKLGISFGLLLSGFGGHFLVPNLIRDMKDPKQADRVVEVAYGVCILVYALVAVFGYLMFGRDVSDEVSRDLAKSAAFSPLLAKVAVWMVALNPLTKLPLGLRPLCDIIYTWTHLHPTVFVPANESSPPQSPTSYTDPSRLPPLTPASVSSDLTMFPLPPVSPAELAHERRERIKTFVRPMIAVFLLFLFVLGALILPSFETIMGIMGGGMAVICCILIPLAAGAGVWGWSWYAVLTFGLSSVLAIFSVGCALANTGEVSA